MDAALALVRHLNREGPPGVKLLPALRLYNRAYTRLSELQGAASSAHKSGRTWKRLECDWFDRCQRRIEAVRAVMVKYGKLAGRLCEGHRRCTSRSEPPHPCPFASEIHGDDSTLCNCCDDCAHGCAIEI